MKQKIYSGAIGASAFAVISASLLAAGFILLRQVTGFLQSYVALVASHF